LLNEWQVVSSEEEEMADLKALAEALISGKADETQRLTQEAVDGGVPVKQVLDEGLIAGMSVVGTRFKNNEFYVPEVLIAARAMNRAMEVLEPLLAESGIEPVGRVAIGTVKGDLHDIGKNLVMMMWKGAGFQVQDLGIDCPPEKFVEAAKNGAQVIGLSALLTTTMINMKDVVQALKDSGTDAKTVIGGAPVTQNYADEIGADGYAADAASAVDTAKELLGV
jgi:5-methyltetrahydrofolate--homocysteine methyltransferase